MSSKIVNPDCNFLDNKESKALDELGEQGKMIAVLDVVPTVVSGPVPFLMEEEFGQYAEFARMVKAILGERSTRAAQIRTGVGHSTIHNMLMGIRPKATTIKLFAEGMGADPTPLLEAAGYPPFTQFKPDSETPASARKVPSLKLEDDEIERIREDDEEVPRMERIPVMPIPEGYNDLDDPIVKAAQAGAEEAYRTTFKTIADALRHARRIAPGTVMGPAPDDDED